MKVNDSQIATISHFRLVYIQLKNTHQSFSGQDLQQLDEKLAIPEICVEIIDSAVDAHQMGVNPLGEGFLLNMLSLI